MNQLEILLLAFALAACGASDLAKTPTGGGPETPPVSAMGGAGETQAPGAGSLDPKAEICLDLVHSASYREALPICVAALEVNPGNLELRHAADKARAETARKTLLGAAASTNPSEAPDSPAETADPMDR